ncbi:MAG: pantetheine-phosphate adenylyltransferase [Dehalococcoidales bacterium]|nr:MAG: pantetheine-phosphate adenylyltransferase [Dehalococcoidales bacterium]
MTIALYPGTFDPITNGHLDIAVRAARLFEKVVIGVYDTPSKDLMFTTEERVKLAELSVTDNSNIEVQRFSGLTVEFDGKVGAKAIVRGLRIGADFEYEREMALMNNKLSPEIELVCLMASLKYQYLSSSRLKEVARLDGDIYDLVPEPVAIAIKNKKFQK